MRASASGPSRMSPAKLLAALSLLFPLAGLLAPGAGQAADAAAGSGNPPETWLGVSIRNVTPEVAAERGVEAGAGVLVLDVISGSPAKRAGLSPGDVILEIDGAPLADSDALCRLIRGHAPGRRVAVKIWRRGRLQSLVATLAAKPPGSAVAPTGRHMAAGGPRLGVTVMPLEQGLARYFKTKPGNGVLITDVAGHSPAQKAGLERGDVILQAGGQPIASPAALRAALKAEPGEMIELEILREGKRRKLKADLTMPGWRRPHAYWLPGPRPRRADLDRDLDGLRRELERLRRELERLGEELESLSEEPD